MRKVLGLGLMGLLGLVLLAYGTVVLMPLERHVKLTRESLEAAELRLAAVQAQVADPEKNGWKSDTFLPFWGRRGREQLAQPAIEDTITDWVAFTTPGAEGYIDHAMLSSAKEPKYLAALTRFEVVAPELLVRMNKPVFAAPEPTPTFDSDFVSAIRLLPCSKAIVGLAAARVCQGRTSEALDMLSAVATLGKTQQSHGALFVHLIGVSIQGVALDAYLGIIDPRSSAKSPQAWRDFAARLTAAVPDQDQARVALEGELLVADNSFEALRRTGKSQTLSLKLIWLPGYLAREQRIYHNFAGDCLASLRAGSVPNLPSALYSASFMDYLTGRTGPALETLALNLNLGLAVMDYNRRKAIGVALAAGVSAYWARHQSLPSDFAKVRTVTDLPSEEMIASVGATLTLSEGKAVVFIPCQYQGKAAESYLDYGSKGWFSQDARGLTFTI